MRVTDADIARIPAANIRVPRAEFAMLWAAAERQCEEQSARGVTDWYADGVAATFEWLAAAVYRPASGPRQDAAAPTTGRNLRATAELIDAECAAAEQRLARQPRPRSLDRRPGFLEGVVATIYWAWHGYDELPLHIDDVGSA